MLRAPANLGARLVARLTATALVPCTSYATGIEDGRWHPAIGDPDVAGRITVLAYALTAWLALLNAHADASSYQLVSGSPWAAACASWESTDNSNFEPC